MSRTGTSTNGGEEVPCCHFDFHFVCFCTKYEAERASMFNQISFVNIEFKDLSLKDKFIFIMQYEWKFLSKYLEAAWTIRQNAMFT